MTDPHEPDDVPDDDVRWRAIVENFGERVDLEGPEPEPPPPAPLIDPEESPSRVAEEDRFVPAPPPPFPRPAPPRLLAWVGLFGVPTFVLVCLVAGVPLPQWLGLLLMAWFVGGFVFLVATMRPDDRDGYDDGAVL